jgi:hypothetical protein
MSVTIKLEVYAMTLTNHVLTGAVIAKFLPLPVAIPLAFASHFVLDALPHFGYKTVEDRIRNVHIFRAIVIVDAVVTALLVLWLLKDRHYAWLLGGAVAYSPDLAWIYRFSVEEKFGKEEPTKGNLFIQFHRGIQKYERAWGLGVEVVYGLATFLLLAR